jgi:hypothetical protein
MNEGMTSLVRLREGICIEVGMSNSWDHHCPGYPAHLQRMGLMCPRKFTRSELLYLTMRSEIGKAWGKGEKDEKIEVILLLVFRWN